MKAAFLVAAALSVVAAMPASARDKFGPWGEPMNLGRTTNSACANQTCESERPAISSVNDPWETPQNLGPPVNTAAQEFSPNLSPNGHWLFFGSDRPGGCAELDIWVSHRKDRDDDFAWEPPVNLGCKLNTSANDDFPFLFVDNEEDITILYFASDRDYGPNKYHIYASTMNEEDGTFGPAVLVRELNCFPPDCVVQRDSRTTIRRDGLEITFGSWNRAGGFGKQDLWVSTRKDTEDAWSKPVNLGSVINTADNEGGPALSRDGTTLYFHSDRPGGAGLLDLYCTTRTKLREDEGDDEVAADHSSRTVLITRVR